MELSKRALGFLSRQYRIILSQNRLANALGSCALSALMCAAVGTTVGVTAGFVAPESALAATTGIEIPAATESWSSTGDISASSTASGTPALGIKSVSTGSISMTLESGHTITVSSDVTGGNSNAVAISAGAMSGKNTIITRGSIDATAAGTGGDVNATGISAGATNNDITNTGTVNAKATATGGSGATAYGLYGEVLNGNVISNSGTVNAIAKGDSDTSAMGIVAANVNDDNVVTNSGTIYANAEATAAGTSSEAYGIYAEAGTDNTIINSGTITITGTADTGNAFGIMAMANNGSNTVTNSGTLNATATGDEAIIYGISAMAGMGNEITNSGTINVTATTESNVTVMGIQGQAGTDNTIINNGTINSQSVGGKSYAYGIVTTATKTGNVTNNGTLNIAAKGDGALVESFGIAAVGDTSNVTNNGTMNISSIASTGEAVALGMVFTGASATFNNFGIIDVSSTGGNTNACQAYVKAGTVNIGTWAMKLGEKYGTSSPTDVGKGYYVFGVASGATLNFGATADQGANFIIYGVGDNFVSGQEYKVSDMVNSDGTVTGYIASATSPFDFLKVEIVDKGTAADYSDQSIKGSLGLSKDNSPTHSGAMQLLTTVQGHMSGLSKVLNDQRAPLSGASNAGGSQSGMRSAKSDTATMYADAGTTVTDAGGSYVTPESPLWKAFLTPFYSTTSAHGDAYETDMGGLVVGASRNMNDALVFGFHASLAKANSDSAYANSDALSYALGVNGVYNIDKSLYVRSQLTGFYAENELDMVSSTGSLAQKASADMDSYGMYVELAAGYDLALAPQHMLTPELGLSYVYAHMEGFDSKFINGSSGTPFSMDSENYNALYADASVRWTGTFDLGNRENGNNIGTLKPTVKAGIRQAIMDPETSSTMNIFGSSATTHADANETSFTCEAGLAWIMDDVTLSATYTGEFGNVDNSHMGMFKAEWEF